MPLPLPTSQLLTLSQPLLSSRLPQTPVAKEKGKSLATKWVPLLPEKLNLSALASKLQLPKSKVLDPQVASNLEGNLSWVSAFDRSGITPTLSQDPPQPAAGPSHL
uniref:Uncharacterized protein n=1 Tax=Moniliophthora roreri TaxID=221103 RepID=A0A0W0FGK1_MONRR